MEVTHACHVVVVHYIKNISQ